MNDVLVNQGATHGTTIVHDTDLDGFTAAWVAHKALTASGAPVTLCPRNHSDKTPLRIDTVAVIFLDLCPSTKEAEALIADDREVMVIDHHKTAAERTAEWPASWFADGKLETVIREDRCAAWLTWEHFFPDRMPPRLVRVVDSRDRWTFEEPHSKELHAALTCEALTFENWGLLAERWESSLFYTDAIRDGAAMLRFKNKMVKEAAGRNRSRVCIDGFDVPCTNATMFISDIGHEMAQGEPFAALWFEREDGQIVYSLRASDESDVDVSAVAKRYGGGGHKKAAGFVLHERLPLTLSGG